MQLAKNDKGFTLVELAVTLGISGIFTVMFMRYSLNSYNQDAHMRYLAEINERLTTLQYALAKPETCTRIFKGMLTATSPTNYTTGTNVPAAGLQLTTDHTLLRVGEYPLFNVNSIQLFNSRISNTGFDLEIRMSPKTTSFFNSFFSGASRNIVKRFTIVGVKQTNIIQSCGPIVSEVNLLAKQTFCANLGSNFATWNSTTNNCEFTNARFRCDTPGTVPYEISGGRLNCIAIAERVNFDYLFDTANAQDCPSKIYTLYQRPDGKITIGCPDSAQRSVNRNLPL